MTAKLYFPTVQEVYLLFCQPEDVPVTQLQVLSSAVCTRVSFKKISSAPVSRLTVWIGVVVNKVLLVAFFFLIKKKEIKEESVSMHVDVSVYLLPCFMFRSGRLRNCAWCQVV